MPLKILFAVLAHDHRAVVEQLVDNLTSNCDAANVIVFNGGPGDDWLAGASFPVATSSRPLHYWHNAPFHHLTMCEVAKRDFDCLVTLDWDVLLIKRGLEAELAELLTSFAYIGTRFSAVDPWSDGAPDRYVWTWWDRRWAGLLKAPQPYFVFNPVQIFRKDLVERFAADPTMPTIIEAVEKSRTPSMEEIVYPTRAVALGAPATSNPGSHGIRGHEFDADELEILAGDPHVFLVHKIAHEHQRAAVDQLLRRAPDVAAAAQRLTLHRQLNGLGRRRRATDIVRRTQQDIRNLTTGP